MNIERRFARLLVEMEAVSFGDVKSFSPTTSTGGKQPPTVVMYGPNRNTWPLHLKWQAIWADTSEDGKPDVLRAAREDLTEWKRRTAPIPRSEQTEDDWILLDGEGHPPEAVASKFRTSPGRVRRLRLEKDRNVETGYFDGDGPRETVDDLIARGLGARQIAMLTGRPASSVQRAINQNRKAA